MEALQAAQSLQMPFEEGLSSLNIGRLDGDHERLAHARDLFQSMGAGHFVEVAARVLRG
jgi:hypothetical protein